MKTTLFNLPLNTVRLCSGGLILVAVFGLAACSDGPVAVDKQHQAVPEQVTITFSAGPNQGKHTYLASGLPNAGVSLSYSKPNAVSFFAASDLISTDGGYSIGSLRRFTAGELKLGENSATSWVNKKSTNTQNRLLDCGRLEIRDHDDEKDYQVVYGTFVDCGPTDISELTDWERDADGNTRSRRVTGQFADRVRLQIAMDEARFQNTESSMVVEFSLVQREPMPAKQ